MGVASKKSKVVSLANIEVAISSLALEDGLTLFVLQGGQLTMFPCGQEVVLASHTATPVNAKGTLTKETSGQTSLGSSASVALSTSLASKCRELLGTDGSMEYRQTWRQKATPLGRVYWEHTASAHRTSAKDCSGWPTPKSQESGDTIETWSNRRERHGSHLSGGKMGLSLSVAAQLAGWPTCKAHDAVGRSPKSDDLTSAVIGTNAESSNVETENQGVLAPEFHRWLMGYLESWDDASPNYAAYCQVQETIAQAG